MPQQTRDAMLVAALIRLDHSRCPPHRVGRRRPLRHRTSRAPPSAPGGVPSPVLARVPTATSSERETTTTTIKLIHEQLRDHVDALRFGARRGGRRDRGGQDGHEARAGGDGGAPLHHRLVITGTKKLRELGARSSRTRTNGSNCSRPSSPHLPLPTQVNA